ncbi:MAG: hypothetical protein JXM74_07215 [Fusobacteriaceae bacterium]|nr:hypothetical protein [Fusobacteriaceae bacterium]
MRESTRYNYAFTGIEKRFLLQLLAYAIDKKKKRFLNDKDSFLSFLNINDLDKIELKHLEKISSKIMLMREEQDE